MPRAISPVGDAGCKLSMEAGIRPFVENLAWMPSLAGLTNESPDSDREVSLEVGGSSQPKANYSPRSGTGQPGRANPPHQRRELRPVRRLSRHALGHAGNGDQGQRATGQTRQTAARCLPLRTWGPARRRSPLTPALFLPISRDVPRSRTCDDLPISFFRLDLYGPGEFSGGGGTPPRARAA